MLSTIHQAGATQAASFLVLAMLACISIVALAIFAWGVGLHLLDLRARRAYRRDRDARRKLERDLRVSRPVGGVSRTWFN